jgi:TonB family protein
MTVSLANIIAYSAQLAILVAAAVAVTSLLRLRAPLPTLRFWQAILAASIVLPLVQASLTLEQAAGSPFVLRSLAAAPALLPLADRSIDAANGLLYVIAAGIAIRMLWLAVGLIRLGAIRRRTAAAPTLSPLLEELSASLGTRAAIALSDDIEIPATIGVRQPLILVPRSLLELPGRVQRAVIAHELMHVRRRDWVHTIAEELGCALLWFNPAARVLSSRLSLARETVVDEAAILLTRDRRSYAEALLAFAKPQSHLPGVTALIGRRQLSQRISLIAEEEVMTRRRLVFSLVVSLFVAGAAASAAVTSFPITSPSSQPAVHRPGNGVTLPVVLEEYKPSYTAAALQEKIQGSVFMAVVVGESGDVVEVTVSKSLDAEYGLDDQAVKAMRRWKFKPAMKDGKAVAVQIEIEMTFTLK